MKSMFASSGRSGTDIIPADLAIGIPSGQVDSTSTSTEFTATIEGITELRDGICVYLTNDVINSASEFTININGLGAKPVYFQQTGAEDLFSKSSTYLFVYNSSRVEGGCWDSYNATTDPLADKFYNGITTTFIRSRETGEGEITRLQGNTVVWNQAMNQDDWVDMGLPSGTLWCRKNIDITQADKLAASEFQYDCSFFSWGNVEGHNPISTSSFDYDWGNINSAAPWYDGQVYADTPGNSLSSFIALNSGYDAAQEVLGSIFRMPTTTEFIELFANIIYIDADGNEVDTTKTDKRVSVNGVMGLYIQSKLNGARLFLSCSGIGAGRSWHYRGSYGRYWSSTWNSARNARGLGFSSGGVSSQYYDNRCRGFAVRPVCNPADKIGKDNNKFLINNKNMFNLTRMFGTDKEPSTTEDFEDWLDKNIGLRDYYDYNEGEIISVKSTAFKTTGFNLFNLATNKAHVIKGQQVQVTGSYTKVLDGEEEITLDSDGFYVPSTEYITIEGADSTTCVHFAGQRNDEYEPYWENIAPLNITTITGKLNGEGESVAVFPDGMKRVGNVYDEIKVENGITKAIKRVGSVDLGTLSWIYRSNLRGMSAALNPTAKNKFYAICSAYPFGGEYSDLSDKQCGYVDRNQIFVKDSSYTDVASFKAAMSDVILYYELATPEEYILDNFDLPVDFKEDAWGVSETLPNSEASLTSLAPVTDLRYLSRVSVLEKKAKSKGPITASSFIKSGGTASQFLKADGSTDDTAYAPLNSPALTGTPTAPTAEANSNNNQVATTAFVKSVIPQTVVLPQFNEEHFGTTNDKVTLVNDKGDYVEYVVTRSDPEGAAAHANSEQLIPSLDYIEYLMEQTGMGLITFTTAKTSISLGLDVCTILTVPVNSLSVSLPIASEGLSTTSKLYVTASDQPAISFTSGQTIKYTKDYIDNPIDSGREYEITAFWNGQFWLISKQEIDVN